MTGKITSNATNYLSITSCQWLGCYPDSPVLNNLLAVMIPTQEVRKINKEQNSISTPISLETSSFAEVFQNHHHCAQKVIFWGTQPTIPHLHTTPSLPIQSLKNPIWVTCTSLHFSDITLRVSLAVLPGWWYITWPGRRKRLLGSI